MPNLNKYTNQTPTYDKTVHKIEIQNPVTGEIESEVMADILTAHISTTAEAIAGTDDTTLMTPLKVKEAVDASTVKVSTTANNRLVTDTNGLFVSNEIAEFSLANGIVQITDEDGFMNTVSHMPDLAAQTVLNDNDKAYFYNTVDDKNVGVNFGDLKNLIVANKNNSKAISRTTATVNVAPTTTEFPTPANGDTATIKLSSGIIEAYNYTAGAWTLAYSTTPAILDGNNAIISRTDNTAGNPPTLTEVPAPINGDTADVYLLNGTREVYAHNGTAWALLKTILPTALDGNDKHIVRASTTPNIAPTAVEVPTPVNGDTAKIFLTDGTIEYWNFQTTWTRDITKLSELTNVRYTTIAPTVIPITDKEGDIAIRTSTGTATGTILGTYVFDGTVWTLISGQDDLVDVSGVVFPLTFPLTTLTGTPVFSPNTPATTGVTYAISDGTNLAYAKWNGTQYISAPAPVVTGDFFRSGTGLTLPNNITDDTENVSRTGKTGFGITNPTDVTSTVDINGTLQIRPLVLANAPVATPNSGVSYNLFDITNTQILANSNIEITGVTVDTVISLGVGASQSAVDLATFKGRELRLSNHSQSTHKLTFKGVDILPGKFLDLIHNGKMWTTESELVENFEQFDLINPDVLIPAFSSGTTTYVDVPSAAFTAPTSGDYLVKYVLYASNGSQINPTKRANDVKWTTDNVLNTFVEIAGSVAEIGTSVGGEINSYTRYFRVRTTRANQVVKMQLNSLSGTTTTYQSATQLSSFNWSRYNSVVAGQQLTNTLIETGAILANNDLFPIVDVSDGVTANQSSYMHRVKRLSNSVMAQQEALTNANSGIIPQTMLQNGITVPVDGWIDYDGSYASPLTLPVPLYDGQIFQVNHLASLSTTILGTNTETGISTVLNTPNTGAVWRAVGTKWYRIDNATPVINQQIQVVKAQGKINLGDFTTAVLQAGAVNVVSAVINSGSGSAFARYDVVLAAGAVSSTNYQIDYEIESNAGEVVTATATVLYSTTAKTLTGFQFALREAVAATQNGSIRFTITETQTITTTNTTNSFKTTVNAGQTVQLGNIKVQVPTTVQGRGFEIGTVTGTMSANITGQTNYAAGSWFTAQTLATALTTTYQHPLGFAVNDAGDYIWLQVRDNANSDLYKVEISIGTAFNSNVIKITKE